jgi:hypothetical protein
MVNTKNALIIIDCNEVINLFFHTLNIYGLLGNHGTNYALRQNEEVISSIDKKIEQDVEQGDRYFSYGKLKIFETGMNYILDNKIWENPIDEINTHMGITEMNFNLAFQKCWIEFYKSYWNDTLPERQHLFEECINAFDFTGSLEKMTIAAHREFTNDFYIFPAEALIYSGLKFNDNVCMGDLAVGEDMGFVHEGLHLLLKEEWANNDEIIEIIKKSNYQEEYYSSWVAKYEQALVVGLDCCIRNKDEKAAENYYNGCNVGDIFGTAYPLIKEYYNGGCRESIENLMLKIISRTV